MPNTNPPNLLRERRNEILDIVNKNILDKFPFFHNNFSQETIIKLCRIMKEECYVTNQYIFQQNQHNDLQIYILAKGDGKLDLFLFNSPVTPPSRCTPAAQEQRSRLLRGRAAA